MIGWRGLYMPAEEITLIRQDRDLEGRPVVTVKTKSAGTFTGVCQSGEQAAAEAKSLSALVARDRGAGSVEQALEALRCELRGTNAGIGLLDKRQRKLWRRLKELRPEIGEEGDE